MFLLRALDLVWLLCTIITVCGAEWTVGANAAAQSDCYRKTCVEKAHNIPKTVCLYPEAVLSCCGEQAFNPATATCCKVGHGANLTANVTEGLSQKVSSCCGLRAYDKLSEICCELIIFAKPGPKSHCCDKKVIDDDKHLCCGSYGNKAILTRKSSHHQCCGRDLQYNNKTQCCCSMPTGFEIHPLNSSCCDVSEQQLRCGPTNSKRILMRKSSDHQCCGQDKQYNNKTECCCYTDRGFEIRPIKHNCCKKESELHCGPNDNKRILKRKSSDHKCCGQEQQYNNKTECCCYTDRGFEIRPIKPNCCKEESELHCGPNDNKRILKRKSSDHKCCGQEQQYNNKTECCCYTDRGFEIRPIKPNCCKEESGAQQQKHQASPKCTEEQTSLCGSSCYDPKLFRCCEKKQTKYHLRSAPGHCGAAPTVYDPHTHVCSYGCVSEWTPHPEQINGLRRQNCCGTEVNHTEICCNGQRHPKIGRMYCCGTSAYDIENQQMKCCSGTLYNLTLFGMSKHDVQCCGSALQNKQDVCCLGDDMEVLYSAKTGFRCCGHHYYNTSLWSCWAGRLSPRYYPNRMITESILLTMDNLNKTHLCEKILIGIVASVSQHQHSIAFNNVLEIHGRNGTVTPLASPHILKAPNRSSFPIVTLGTTYFFDQVNMYTDFNHDSILQSIHSIFTKCSRHKVVAG